MPLLAFSALDALATLGLAVAGFIVVALVCVGVLAVLHLVLPSTDSGADELDRLNPPDGGRSGDGPAQVDTEANA